MVDPPHGPGGIDHDHPFGEVLEDRDRIVFRHAWRNLADGMNRPGKEKPLQQGESLGAARKGKPLEC
jgi:hypothetical protein